MESVVVFHLSLREWRIYQRWLRPPEDSQQRRDPMNRDGCLTVKSACLHTKRKRAIRQSVLLSTCHGPLVCGRHPWRQVQGAMAECAQILPAARAQGMGAFMGILLPQESGRLQLTLLHHVAIDVGDQWMSHQTLRCWLLMAVSKVNSAVLRMVRVPCQDLLGLACGRDTASNIRHHRNRLLSRYGNSMWSTTAPFTPAHQGPHCNHRTIQQL